MRMSTDCRDSTPPKRVNEICNQCQPDKITTKLNTRPRKTRESKAPFEVLSHGCSSPLDASLLEKGKITNKI